MSSVYLSAYNMIIANEQFDQYKGMFSVGHTPPLFQTGDDVFTAKHNNNYTLIKQSLLIILINIL